MATIQERIAAGKKKKTLAGRSGTTARDLSPSGSVQSAAPSIRERIAAGKRVQEAQAAAVRTVSQAREESRTSALPDLSALQTDWSYYQSPEGSGTLYQRALDQAARRRDRAEAAERLDMAGQTAIPLSPAERRGARNQYGAQTRPGGVSGGFGGSSAGETRPAFSGHRPTADERARTLGGRLENLLHGAAGQYAGSVLSGIGTGVELMSESPSSNAVRGALETAEKNGRLSSDALNFLREAADREAEGKAAVRDAGGSIRDAGRSFAQYGQERADQAKEGLGGLGRFAVDVGIGAAQLGGDIAAGQMTGVGVMGPLLLRSFGSGAEEAAQDGASLSQQAQYGMASAMLEAATEKISSLGNFQTAAFGSGAVDDILEGIVAAVERAGKTEAGRAALNRAASAGVGFLSEGAEEFVSGVLSPLLKRSIYSKDPIDWKKTVSEAGYEFLTGGAIGALSGGLGGTETARHQQAYLSRAVDQAQNDAYRAMAENGVFSREGSQAARDALNRMDRAWERTGADRTFSQVVRDQLGGARAARAVVDANGGNDASQLATRSKTNPDATLSAQETGQNPQRGQGDTQVPPEAQAETAQTGENVNTQEAEISSGKPLREANIRRTDRRTLENLAKITGSEIRFVPRAQLEQMAGVGAEGMQLNGQIYISEDAARPYMEIAKHELTHRLQQTAPEDYAAFRDYAAEAYRADGTLESYIRGLQENRARAGLALSEEAALDEIAADYAASLLVDERAVRRLAGENRGLLTRMLDALRDFIAKVKSALGGRSNAQTEELERGAALWQKALEASSRNSGAEGDGQVRYSIRETGDGKKYVQADRQVITGQDPEVWAEQVEDYINYKIRRGEDVELLTEDGDALLLTKDTAGKAKHAFRPDGSRMSDSEYETKLNAESHIDELAQISTRGRIRPDVNGRHGDFAPKGWQYRTAYFQDFDGNYYRVQISVAQNDQGNIVYNIGDIRRRSPSTAGFTASGSSVKDGAQGGETSSENTIPQPTSSVNPPRTFSDELTRQLTGERESTPPTAESTDTATEASATPFSEEIARQLGGGETRLSTQEDADLKRQMDALRRQNQRLREQMRRTVEPEMDAKSVRALSKSFLKDYSSAYAVEDLSGRLGELYKKIAGQTVSDQEARAEARAIAGDILDGSQTELNPLYGEYSDLRNELRTRAMTISPEYRADLDAEGGYNEVRKRYMGRLRLSNDGAAVDQVYDDLSTRYPELFPDDIYHPADQLSRIMEVSDELQSVMGSPYEGGEMDRAADFLAGEILERFYDTPERSPTFADRQERRLQNQRAKDRARLDQAVAREQGRTQRARETLQSQREADRQKLLDTVSRERGKKDAALKSLRDQYQEANRRRIENQNAAERRETIRRAAGRLSRKLLAPTDKSHIPEDLRGAVTGLLQAIDLESAYSTDLHGNRLQTEEGAQLGTPTKRSEAARALQAKYAELAAEGNLTVDPDMQSYLDELAGMGDTPLSQLDRSQLDTIWKVVQVVEHTVSRADDMLGQSRYAKVSELAETLLRSAGGKKSRTNFAGALGAADKLLNMDMLTPETYFHLLGEGGEAIFRQMRSAADRQTAVLKEGVDRAKALVEETGVNLNRAEKELHTFQTSGGELKLTTAQIMELYALSKREQAMEHIYTGGLKPSGARDGLKLAGRAAPVQVTPADAADILDVLTPEQKKLADGLQEYLSGDLAGHGNEASMDVYGYKKFKEKNYWPIQVDRNQTRTDVRAEAESKTVAGYGMTKAVKPKANNAVVLRGILESFTGHLNEMSTYSGWLAASEDVNRVHNYVFKDENGNRAGTVKTLLEQVFGSGGNKYLDQLMGDIALGTKAGTERSATDGLFNTWKAAKVGGNLRVILQQPTAILRAASMIDPKYFAQAQDPMKGWKKAVEHSPIAQWKDWGYFELDTGRSLKELIAGTDSALGTAKNAMMQPAGWADSVAWGHLWNAVEAETADKYKHLQRGGGAFYEKAAERFGEIIDRTQVVDSVLHRTQIMRSGNALNRMATSFMSEPSKIYNMVCRDLWDLVTAERGQRGQPAKALARSAIALTASFAVNAIAQSLPDAWRDKDRDESWKKRFSDAWVENFLENFDPVGYLPYLKDIESILQGYDASRSDMEGIADIAEAGKDLYKAVNGESKKTALASGLDAAVRFLDVLGLPAYNIKRDVAGILQHALIDAGAEDLVYALDKLLVNPEKDAKTFYDDLYRTMGRDYEQYKSVYQDMAEQSWTSGEELKSAVEERMRKDLGLQKSSSLPVEYSAPGSGGSFDGEVRRQLERGGTWKDALPEGSADLAGRLDALEPEEGENAVTKRQRVREIRNAPYSDEVKELSVRRLLAEKELERFEAAKKAGLSVDQWCGLYEDIAAAREARTGKNGSASAQDVALVLDGAGLTDRQKDAVWESYGWESDWRDSIAGKDLSRAVRARVADALNALSPEEGEKTVSSQRKYEAITALGLSDGDTLGALETVMSAGERKKLSAAYSQGVSPGDYVAARAVILSFDEDENGTITQDEAKRALKSMGFLSNEEKAALWQAQNKSWKPENNPFHRKTGRKVYDALHEGYEE